MCTLTNRAPAQAPATTCMRTLTNHSPTPAPAYMRTQGGAKGGGVSPGGKRPQQGGKPPAKRMKRS